MAYWQRMILGYESLLIQGFPMSLLHDMTAKFNPSNKFLHNLAGRAYNAGVLTHVLNVWCHVADFGSCSLWALNSIPYTHRWPTTEAMPPRRRPYCCNFLVLGLPKQESAFGWVAEEGDVGGALATPTAATPAWF